MRKEKGNLSCENVCTECKGWCWLFCLFCSGVGWLATSVSTSEEISNLYMPTFVHLYITEMILQKISPKLHPAFRSFQMVTKMKNRILGCAMVY